MTVTAIAAVRPRRRTTVLGEVVSVVCYERPWVRTDAEVTDGTGLLVLRFFGRAAIPGLVAGSRIVAEGTAGRVGSVMVMLNPLSSFTRTAGRPPPAGSRCRERS
jgi:hypothetical protein